MLVYLLEFTTGVEKWESMQLSTFNQTYRCTFGCETKQVDAPLDVIPKKLMPSSTFAHPSRCMSSPPSGRTGKSQCSWRHAIDWKVWPGWHFIHWFFFKFLSWNRWSWRHELGWKPMFWRAEVDFKIGIPKQNQHLPGKAYGFNWAGGTSYVDFIPEFWKKINWEFIKFICMCMYVQHVQPKFDLNWCLSQLLCVLKFWLGLPLTKCLPRFIWQGFAMSLELKSSLLEQAESKLKVEHGAVKGDVIPSPSPKKPASEFEKKLKNMPGDTSLVKDWTDCAFNNFCTFITLHFQKLLPQFYHIIWTYLISNFRICFTTYNCIPWRMGTSTAFIPCSVSSTLCGENRDGYAQQLENWFDAYATTRGLKAKMFKPTSGCVSLEKVNCNKSMSKSSKRSWCLLALTKTHVVNTDLSLSSRPSMSLWRMTLSSFPWAASSFSLSLPFPL